LDKLIVETTADGSHTLFLPEMDEHYHSVNGAVQESNHVYIDAGFNQCQKEEIHVLELGFGTGLNALLTALQAEQRGIRIFYTSLEKFPLPQMITEQLNYSEANKTLYQTLLQTDWGIRIQVNPYFNLHKIQTDFNDFDFSGKYDVVYYDAFAPDKQPEVWSQKLFDAIYNGMNPEGILTTYCAKGNIRRMMQQAGFTVVRIPGPPGKREMLRARKVVC